MIEVLRQAAELKRRHPDTILFFRLGDFYEVFGDDAGLVARELQITLTSRPTGNGDRTAMAGVPVHSADQALARLLARGHKVVMAEHLAEAALDPAEDGYFCFACGASGDVVAFMRRLDGLSFTEVVARLGDATAPPPVKPALRRRPLVRRRPRNAAERACLMAAVDLYGNQRAASPRGARLD